MLEFHIGTILFQIIVVIILIALVSKFALRPMLNVMNSRQQHIEEQLETADNNRKEAEELLQKQQAELKAARQEGQKIQDDIKKRAESEAEDILNQANARADRMIEEAKEEINNERDRAVANLRDEVSHLSMLLASKVLEREVDEKDHEKEVDTFIKQVGDRL